MSKRLQCINCPNYTYSGNEKSPLHYGLSAEGYDINTIMEGYDKMQWIVKNKNNKNVWVRIYDTTLNITNQSDTFTNNLDYLDISTNKKEEIEKQEKVEHQHQEKSNVIKEKTISNYNIYLKYRLYQLKNDKNNSKIKKKDLFKLAIQDWNKIKNTEDFNKIIEIAKEFSI